MNKKVSTIVSSITLIVLTAVVFSSAISITPENTLRRFIGQGQYFRDDLLLAPCPPAIKNFVQQVTSSLAKSNSLEIIRQDRKGDLALLITRVRSEDGMTNDYMWFMVNTPRGWRIDLESTFRAWATR